MWRNVVQVSFSYPIGVLADWFGSLPVLRIGYALGALTAFLTGLFFWLGIDSIALPAGIFFTAELYAAAQDSLESTVTADIVNADTLAISYGALGTVNGVAKFVSSAGVDVLWTLVSPVLSFELAALFMAAGTWLLHRLHSETKIPG
jgi:hypothetical protein